MAWDRSYSHTVLMALDQFGGAILFNRPDLTISAMCWMVANDKETPLKLWGWQRFVLACLGALLNRIQTNHMELAREGDQERARSTLEMLQ